MSTFEEATARAHNTYQDQLHMPRGPVLQPVSQNKPVSHNKPKLFNPYKVKPTFSQASESYRQSRPYARRPYREPVDMSPPKDDILGNIGGAEIDFGNGGNGTDAGEKEKTEKDDTGKRMDV